MALGGITAGLNTAVPSSTSQAGVGYQDLQSIKTTFQQVLDSEHNMPSSGGANSGVHRKGSAVVFVGAASAISSTDTDGRLMLDTTNGRLQHAGSSDTQFLGGRYVVESAKTMHKAGASDTTSRITQVWAMEAGSAQFLPGSSTTVITLNQTFITAVATTAINHASTTFIGGVPGANVSGNQLAIGNVIFSSTGTGTVVNSPHTYVVNYIVMGIKAL